MTAKNSALQRTYKNTKIIRTTVVKHVHIMRAGPKGEYVLIIEGKRKASFHDEQFMERKFGIYSIADCPKRDRLGFVGGIR